ncbi:MAG TPA: PsiF family protein [Rhodanobacteraceae bacterium]|nr:PsiF family protein [Rhodanobacteraceae bacterium]
MRIRSSMLALGLALGALAAAPAFAAAQGAATHKPMTASQQKMSSCSHQSRGMKGEAHEQFMSDCMHGKVAAAPARTSQQEKMKTCNAEAGAKALKGAARKSFMSSCLKG